MAVVNVDVAKQSSLDALDPKLNSTIGTARELALDEVIRQNSLYLGNIVKKVQDIGGIFDKLAFITSANV